MTILIPPRVHDLGGFQVRRAVPSLQARSVGPFVFVDHMGPAHFEAGHGVDVRPHPHIGLATVTFLWSGGMRHRHTLGSLPVAASPLPGARRQTGPMPAARCPACRPGSRCRRATRKWSPRSTTMPRPRCLGAITRAHACG